jgi:hypothetical protein
MLKALKFTRSAVKGGHVDAIDSVVCRQFGRECSPCVVHTCNFIPIEIRRSSAPVVGRNNIAVRKKSRLHFLYLSLCPFRTPCHFERVARISELAF